ncbi:hypothetical protein K439DRAFT_777352 [Ramaria rubella]|nr:hypothetical protein K439DRAFT_777352 [Ramaria rubella]
MRQKGELQLELIRAWRGGCDDGVFGRGNIDGLALLSTTLQQITTSSSLSIHIPSAPYINCCTPLLFIINWLPANNLNKSLNPNTLTSETPFPRTASNPALLFFGDHQTSPCNSSSPKPSSSFMNYMAVHGSYA